MKESSVIVESTASRTKSLGGHKLISDKTGMHIASQQR